jgi:hypothetical protein
LPLVVDGMAEVRCHGERCVQGDDGPELVGRSGGPRPHHHHAAEAVADQHRAGETQGVAGPQDVVGEVGDLIAAGRVALAVAAKIHRHNGVTGREVGYLGVEPMSAGGPSVDEHKRDPAPASHVVGEAPAVALEKIGHPC